jgi:hypothetical protein
MLKRIPYFAVIALATLIAGWIASAPAQPPPPAGKDKTGDKKGKDKKGDEFVDFQGRLDRLRSQLQFTRAAGQDMKTLLQRAGTYAERAGQASTTQPYIADRTLAAGEALFRASDHLQRAADTANYPPPLPPPAQDFGRRLAHAYFRTREADFFLQEARDNTASPLPALARQYYQRAVQAYDAGRAGADVYLGAAEEIVNALEFLAQAANLAPELQRQ